MTVIVSDYGRLWVVKTIKPTYVVIIANDQLCKRISNR